MIFYKAATVAAILIVLEAPGGHALAQYYLPGAYPTAQAPLNQSVPFDPDNDYDTATMPRGAIVSTRGDPRNVAALPPEVRPETGPKKELPPQFRRTLVDYYTRNQPARSSSIRRTPISISCSARVRRSATGLESAAKGSPGPARKRCLRRRNGPIGIHRSR